MFTKYLVDLNKLTEVIKAYVFCSMSLLYAPGIDMSSDWIIVRNSEFIASLTTFRCVTFMPVKEKKYCFISFLFSAFHSLTQCVFKKKNLLRSNFPNKDIVFPSNFSFFSLALADSVDLTHASLISLPKCVEEKTWNGLCFSSSHSNKRSHFGKLLGGQEDEICGALLTV